MTDKILNKILLAEDEPDIQMLLKYALEKIGKFTVKYCSSGQELLECAEDFSPDLILLDVMMPGMDGVTTFNALQKIPSLKDIPVIFMTAKVQTHEITHYKALGALDVISKPFEVVTLATKILNKWNESL